MSKGITRRVQAALRNVRTDIERNTDRNSMYSRGLSVEGYRGGYADALQDVLLLLHGVEPPHRARYYWTSESRDG